LLLAGSCGSSTSDPNQAKPPPSTVSVWRCQIPLTTTSTWFEPAEFRLGLDAADLAGVVSPAAAWFDRQSGGQYVPTFEPGGDVAVAAGDGPDECVAEARRRLGEALEGQRLLLVIADAEHRGDRAGGWGVPGVAYVGAADFHPEAGPLPPLDLVEHELGHALGWPHSGLDGALNSGLDAMSDSAAPRQIDPQRRDAPGVLAPHRASAGWLDDSQIVDVDADICATPGASAFSVAPWPPSSSESAAPGNDATQLVRVWPSTKRTGVHLTIEAKRDAGDDDHLDGPGIVIHRVEESRDLTPLVGEPPFLRPLAAGESWSGDGWTISVADDPTAAPPGERWLVSCRFGERLPAG
jgi:hypothetical protein